MSVSKPLIPTSYQPSIQSGPATVLRRSKDAVSK